MSSSSSTQVRNWRRVWRLTTAILIALLFLVPIVYVVMISLESPKQFLDHPLVPPVPPSVQNFSSAYQQGDLGVEVLNTIIYSVSAAAISTGLSLLIAFPIARKLIRWSSWVFAWFVIGICLPLPIIPLFIEARALHLYDNRIGYILLHVEPGLPLGVILLTAFILGIPKELDEAAWIDGAPYFRYLASVIVPVAWPSLVIIFLYSLLAVWNDIIGPVVLLASPNLFPVARGVYSFYSSNQSAYTLLAAAVMIVSLPVALLFVVSQRQLLRATMGMSR
jgi:raffinose/stachyose/melibiose transport system permease protein